MLFRNIIYTRFLVVILILISFAPVASGQMSLSTIKGAVKDSKGNPMPFATVFLKENNIATTTDEKGQFVLQTAPGVYTLSCTSVGYKQHTCPIEVKEDLHHISVNMIAVATQINEVKVKGEAKHQRISKSGFAVTSVDMKDMQAKSADLNEVLDRIPGLRVRRDGGLGSRTGYNLNGLSGRSIRIFIDGMPAESYGSSYSINSLPVSIIERVDVYKGVVPIEFGNDAMGGVINIVTKQFSKHGSKNNSLNLAYSYGSFNTNRADVNASWRSKKIGITGRISGFFNYADNDYQVWSDDIAIKDYDEFLPDGTRNPDFLSIVETGVKVRRFHDAYKSYGAKADFGVTNKNWADQFMFSINLSKDYKELQHGPRMIQPYGERYIEGWTVAPSVNYKKRDIFVKGLNMAFAFQYSRSEQSVVDTTTNRYDWYGNLIPEIDGVERLPGESGTASLNIDDNDNYIGSAAVSYRLNHHHTFAFKYTNNTFKRSSDDAMQEAVERSYGSTNKVNKQIGGLTYQNLSLNDRLQTSVFGKYYYNLLEQDRVEYSSGDLDTIQSSRPDSDWGYGATASFKLSPRVQLMASAERAIRLVSTNEVFGNVSQEIVESTDLEPEKSFNLNLGGMLTFIDNNHSNLKLNTNLFYRNITDRIRRDVVVQNDDSYSVYNNIGHILSKGIEAQLDYSIKNKWNFMLQGYYLDSRYMEEYASNGSINLNYESREPNVPWLTSAFSVEYIKRDLFRRGNSLSVSWYTSYIHEFNFDWDVIGNQNKPIVPDQLISDMSISYTFAQSRLVLSLDGKNLTNEMAFDNYAIQKPGRAFYCKLLYRIF